MAILDLLPCSGQQRWRRLSDSLEIPELVEASVPEQNVSEKSYLLPRKNDSLTSSPSSTTLSSSETPLRDENDDYTLDSENVPERFRSSFELRVSDCLRASHQQLLLAHSRSVNASKVYNSGYVSSPLGIASHSELRGSSSNASRWHDFKKFVRRPFKETQVPNVEALACKNKITEGSNVLEARTDVIECKDMNKSAINERNKQASSLVHKKSSASKENLGSSNKYMHNPKLTNKKGIHNKSTLPLGKGLF